MTVIPVIEPPAEEEIQIDPLVMIGAALLAQTGAITLMEAREMIGMPSMTSEHKRRLSAIASYSKATGVLFEAKWAEFWPRGGQ